MKLIFKIALLVVVCSHTAPAFAQTGIGTLTPDASAQLDVVSTGKGMLTPRMTTIQRTGISNPADGLLVYDTDTQSFWYYKTGTGWSNVQSVPFSLPYLANENNNNHLFTITNSGNGTPIGALSSSSAANAKAIEGVIDSPSPGAISSGVSGIHRGTGFNGIGVYGEHSGGGKGVYGSAATGIGVYGISPKGTGVLGFSDSAYGVQAGSLLGIGLFATSTDSFAIRAVTNKQKPTVRIENTYTGSVGSTYTAGLYVSQADSGYGIIATSAAGAGLLGSATNGIGIIGTSSNRAGTFGYSYSGAGVQAESSYGIGITADSYDSSAARFENSNSGNTSDIVQVSNTGSGNAVKITVNGSGRGIFSQTVSGNSIYGETSSGIGVYGYSALGTGVQAISGNGTALVAQTSNAIGSVAQFRNGITANINPVLTVETISVGSIVTFRSGTTTANLANVARIDNTGKGYFNGGTQNSGADIAEAFDVVNEINEYEPGDVLVISQDHDRTVEKSDEAYSSLVIGVYATNPGVLLTEENIETDISDKVPMGVVGVIPTKVCTDGGIIKRGDMLVTSSRKGVAMKADPNKIKTGQIIGKALQNYDGNGVGKINVFVNVK